MRAKTFIIALMAMASTSCNQPRHGNDMRLGAHAFGDSLRIALEAPGKESVSLLSDANNWAPIPMTQHGSRWETTIAKPNSGGICYQFCVDSHILIADPYSQVVLWGDEQDKALSQDVRDRMPQYPADKTGGAVTWLELPQDKYAWRNGHVWIDENNTVIYEILVRDFSAEGTFNGITSHIDHLKRLGVSAVELMPINEFGGNDSWGYNPEFLFAVDKAYGLPDDLRILIDELHGAGISVIVDVVLNHAWFSSPLVMLYANPDGSPADGNPWFNSHHNFENHEAQWGADFNHDSPMTQALVDSVIDFWVKQFRVDGIRLDFTKGFSNKWHPDNSPDQWGNDYDEARIRILNRLFAEARRRNPHISLICEHLADMAEEKALSETGFLLWADANWAWGQTLMGWRDATDASNLDYHHRGLNKPSLVGFMESHDQERLMHKCLSWGNRMPDGSYDASLLPTAISRAKAATIILLSIPGPKMIWQFGELGYDVGIDFAQGQYSADGRTARKPDGWNLLHDSNRLALLETYAKMIDLHQHSPLFATDDYEADLTGLSKHVTLYGYDGKCALAIANFDVFRQTLHIHLLKGGLFKDLFSDKQILLRDGDNNIELEAGEGLLLLLND